MPHVLVSFALLLWGLTTGCGGSGESKTPDPGLDSSVDDSGSGGGNSDGSTTLDATLADANSIDASTDASTDSAVDAATDAGSDATSDASSDASSDTGVDAATDAGSDAGSDASSDASADTGVDGSADAATDAGADGGAGGGVDAATDAGTDSSLDAGSDAAIDSGLDAGADGSMDGAMGPAPCTDLNCDGLPDLIVVENREGSSHSTNDWNLDSYVYYNQAGSFDDMHREAIAGLGAISASVGDINEDGYLDIVLVNHQSSQYSWNTSSKVYFGNGTDFSTIPPFSLPSSGALNAVVDDMDGDSHLDVVFAEYRDSDSDWTRKSRLYWGNGAGDMMNPTLSTSRKAEFGDHHGAFDVKVVDFDHDGRKDIIFNTNRHYSSYNLSAYVYWGDSLRFAVGSKSTVESKGGREIHIFDANGDGFEDFLLFSYRSGSTSSPSYVNSSYVYTQNTASGTKPGRFTNSNRTAITTTGAVQAAVGLIDNDSNPDIVFFGYHNSGWANAPTSVFEGSAYTMSSDLMSGASANGMRYGELHDLDSDGHLDLVTARLTDGGVYAVDSLIYWGSATGLDAMNPTTLPTLGAEHVTVGDLNGDGCPEIIYSNGRDNTSWNGADNYIYHGDPLDCRNGYSTAHRTVLNTARTAKTVIVGDASW